MVLRSLKQTQTRRGEREPGGAGAVLGEAAYVLRDDESEAASLANCRFVALTRAR